ncbi:MAG: DUF4982 domain-containing protein [Planctomycetes bacterium]|nr:DUF4982 domain-containing protein [Planctomycetota bacterium]
MEQRRMQVLPWVFCTCVFLSDCFSESRQVNLFDQIADDAPRSRLLFDFGWRFYRGGVDNAQAPDFDDSAWRLIDLPHDWSIEDIPGTNSPLDSKAVGGIDTGYFVGGIGWYRKTFHVPRGLAGKQFHLQFGGIYMNADIWLNGQPLGNHPYGYTAFWYDVTDKLLYGAENVVAVKVRNEGKNSRWYSGSGIYRHVWLTLLNPIHIAHWGTAITTPDVTQEKAKVAVQTEVENSTSEAREIVLRTTILDPQGMQAATVTTQQLLPPGDKTEIHQDMQVHSPALWSTDTPVLYTAVTEIIESSNSIGSGLLDRIETPFGIRSIEFSAEKGLLLNGQSIMIKGACMHHGNGPLGAAAYDRAEERRVELMKASGYNSIRCAHNPPSEAFLDACDRLGLLVIDEAFDMWEVQNWPQDYHLYFKEWWKRDIESMVLRDRNHPSIFMWSTGNEIKEMATPRGVATSRVLTDTVHALDPTRPVTAAINNLGPDKDPFFATLDIAGYNYSFGGDHGKKSIFELDRGRVPDRIMYCAESYPLEAFGAWMNVLDYPYVFGDYVWTGFDYLGEASIGWLGYLHRDNFHPWHQAFCGDIDICGFKRPQSYYRDALWQHREGSPLSVFVKPPQPSFEMLPGKKGWSKWNWQDVVADWNWPGHGGESLEVIVYSAYEKVELILNGRSLGTRDTNRSTEWTAQWQVPYQPGTLAALGYEGGRKLASWQLRTAEQASKIKLTADRTEIRADGQDLSYITVELLDTRGIRHPKAQNLIEFSIQGPGTIVAVGSSNPRSTESYRQPQRRAYQGRCLVIVKSSKKAGTITLSATSTGLQSADVVITSIANGN